MSNKVHLVKGRSGAEIESIASLIIKQYQPEIFGKPETFDVEAFFDVDLEALTGLTPDYLDLPSGVHGYTDLEEKKVVVDRKYAESSKVHERRFWRSTVGHECGHAILHAPELRLRKNIRRFVHNDNSGLRLHREEVIPPYRNAEWQAWRFAAALLMPKVNVLAALSQGANKLSLPEIFDVNPAFIETRLKQLKIRDK